MTLAAAAVMTLVAVACGSSSKPATPSPSPLADGSDASQVEQLVLHELALTRAGNWQELHATFSPKLQQRCPLDRFVAARSKNPNAAATSDVQYSDIRVRIEDDRAYVTFNITLDRTPVQGITDARPNPYAKIDGHWYYDDPASSC